MNLMSQLHKKPKGPATPSLARHEAFIDEYIEWLGRAGSGDPAARRISVIARSPMSPVAAAIMSRGAELRRRRVTIQVIVAELGADAALAGLGEAVTGNSRGDGARELVRWARKRCLREAHEQIILGTAMCWSGDSMRREPGKRDGLDLFERDAPKVVRLGLLAFDAIWEISERIPLSRLDPAMTPKPSATYAAQDPDGLSVFSFLRRSERSNTLAH